MSDARINQPYTTGYRARHGQCSAGGIGMVPRGVNFL